jgi:hypothetical protein
VTLEHRRGRRLDGRPVADVALDVLVGARVTARQPDDVRPSRLQPPDQLGADARARAGDDGDAERRARYLQTFTRRPAVAVRPRTSTTVAVRR